MMKLLHRLYHFFGGVRLAIFLIGAAAICVIIGTFIESSTQSHRYASAWIYSHPLFTCLLCLFFVNILFAALRRWPFKWRHIPFLITHLGLLMLLGGAIIKNYAGTQGAMSISEGCCNQEIVLEDTYVLQVEKKDPQRPNRKIVQQFPILTSIGSLRTDLKDTRSIYDKIFGIADTNNQFAELKIKLLAYQPNVKEKLETWIKGNQVHLSGNIPMPVYVWNEHHADDLPISGLANLGSSVPWKVMAFRSDDVGGLAKKVFLQELDLILTDRQSGKVIFKAPLSTILTKTVTFENVTLTGDLHFEYSTLKRLETPYLMLNFFLSDGQKGDLKIELKGPNALLNINESTSYLGSFPIAVDLVRANTLLIIQDQEGADHLFAFDQHGSIFNEIYHPDLLASLMVYDQGYRGYAVHADIPFGEASQSREDKELANLHDLGIQLHRAMDNHHNLTPPLQLLFKATQKAEENFTEVLLEYLFQWDQSYEWLLPNANFSPRLSKVLSLIDWQSEPLQVQIGCQKACHIFETVERFKNRR